MGVPFGFSVGDLIAGIGVIKTSIDAFSDTRGATKDHRQLSDTLASLSETLELVQAIEVDPLRDARQRDAIRRAVRRCQTCIEDFACSIARYKIIQPGLRPSVWRSRVAAAAKKVQWALCKKEDIAKFRRESGLQVEHVGLLLTTLNIHQQQREAVRQEADRNQNVAHREVLLETRAISQQTHALVGRQSTALDSLRSSQAETQLLVNALQRGMSAEQRSMLNLFSSMIDLQNRNSQSVVDELSRLSAQVRLQPQTPPQVLLQQPVIFRDALDRVTPVHLDFIDSAEAFVAVLKVRFKDVGLRKLERNEFLLEDGKDKRSLDLRRPWAQVMQPGQHVTMSMLFMQSFEQNICPVCSVANEGYHWQETTCVNCGRTYRLVENKLPLATGRNRTREEHLSAIYPPAEGILDGKVSDFRRVRLVGASHSGSLYFETLSMAQQRSVQEEQAMRSMTSSVLEDVGMGGSPLTAGSG